MLADAAAPLREVAVTGMGVVSALGSGAAPLLAAALAGRSGVGTVTRFDATSFPVGIAAEVRHELDVPHRLRRRIDRATTFGLAAGQDAIRHAGIDPATVGQGAVVVGTGIGGVNAFEEQEQRFRTLGVRQVSPYVIAMIMPNATAAHLGMQLGLTGPSMTITNACAAGATAIGEAAQLVAGGRAPWALAGGVEAAITPLVLQAFHRMGALSPGDGHPAAACRPFDRDRQGFVLGEGAAFLVLEPLGEAQRRGATVHGTVAGYGASSDAFHIAAPEPTGAQASAAMQRALDDAGLTPTEIGHVNAHGTGTSLNDQAEALAIDAVFGPGRVPVTSTKPVTGHLLGAGGAVEAVLTLAALGAGAVPPTLNHAQLDPTLHLDVVAGEPRPSSARHAISNSFAFGGHNVALVLGGPR
ncbi:MAG: 3-oxoacyl-(acyl-carrier-protein) synthase 2 [Acidimicrobiales bacterium]|nr:3-oxoacyl-(acyl-carrier-protein) synthase 2 [Acidimicrobiales bacterium]